MTERVCRNCRFYLMDGFEEGDCINVQSRRFVTKAASTCDHFAIERHPMIDGSPDTPDLGLIHAYRDTGR
jgi:hypothetical protein